ncbi:OmpA family protein [Paraliomyxa miuraensis]|uniref:OmpA family protein n=1 Tax=Paraliomyxa miuraensis TaxID=376150 RepID=UPI00225117FB|nr:OmpA family protein [Paraliomyxa miuraensis]MCX4243359.1 OmpA family protein [Paraliomyxa miuraensis]
MRRALLAISIAVLMLPVGCKRKELEAQLAEVQDKLAKTEAALDQEKKTSQQLRDENQTYQARIAELEGELVALNKQIEDLAAKAGTTAKELAELRAEKAKREKELQVYKDLFGKLKAMVDAGTIQVGFRKGRMVVQLSNAILFDSGKSSLRAEGNEAIASLAPALVSVDREFLVAGHTDNVPIKTARYPSNWELSTARAVSVVKALIEAGYPAAKVGAAGYGENDPVGDNTTDEGKEQNRRIEIILMPNLGEIPGMKEMLQGKR